MTHAIWRGALARASAGAAALTTADAMSVADCLRALCQIRINGAALLPWEHAAAEDAIGLGMFPVASLLTHACRPNVSVRFEGKTQIVRTPGPLPAATPLLHCYGPQAGEMTTAQRRSMLQDQYCFLCKCPACAAPAAAEVGMAGLRCADSACDGAVPAPGEADSGLVSEFGVAGSGGDGGAACTLCGGVLSPSQWNSEVRPELERARELYATAYQHWNEADRAESEGRPTAQKTSTAARTRCLAESLAIRQKRLHATNQVLGATHGAYAWACEAGGDVEGAAREARASLEVAAAHYQSGSTQIAFLERELALRLKALYEATGDAAAGEEAEKLTKNVQRALRLHFAAGEEESGGS